MKCLIIAKSMENAATRYRVAPVVRHLRGRGDVVTLICEPDFFSQLWLLARAVDCDRGGPRRAAERSRRGHA